MRSSMRCFWAVVSVVCVALTAPQALLAAGYLQRNLVSDVPLLADYTDPNMVNPWGLALSPFWVCNNRSATYNVQGSDGAPTTVITTVPAAPGSTAKGSCTGAVRNNNAAAFLVSPGVAGTWLLDTEDGLITIRSGATNVIKVDNSTKGAVYKGIALSNNPDYVYAANFNSGKIDVYDGTWTAATLAGSFSDPQVPAGFAPFNIQNIGGKLYVTYAKQNAAKNADVAGAGSGYVAVFDLQGNLIQHLVSGAPLNSPWGVAIAPATFGDFKGALLVGNFGDGTINAFDPATGKSLGALQDPSGKTIVISGLWALVFGGGGSGGYQTVLYFTAGISAGSGVQSHGLLGTLATTAAPAVNANGIVNNAGFAAGTGPLAPGSIAAIFGANLTEGLNACLPPACNPTFRTDKRLNTTLAGTQVLVNGIPAPIYYASPVQIGFQIPTELSAGGTATVQVTAAGQSSTPSTVNIAQFAPGVFFTGTNVGAVTHADGSAVTTANPAAQGETVIIYGSGFGATAPAVATGLLSTGTTNTITSATATIDGLPATVNFSGLANCCVGLNQVNVVVPTTVRVATNVPVVVSVGGQAANTVTIATKAAPIPEPR